MEEEKLDDVVVQPEQMSVSELRRWLAQFAETNREHYQSSQVHKARQLTLHSVEDANRTLSTSSSFGSNLETTEVQETKRIPNRVSKQIDSPKMTIGEAEAEIARAFSQDETVDSKEMLDAIAGHEQPLNPLSLGDAGFSPIKHSDEEEERHPWNSQSITRQQASSRETADNQQNNGGMINQAEWDEIHSNSFSSFNTNSPKSYTSIDHDSDLSEKLEELMETRTAQIPPTLAQNKGSVVELDKDPTSIKSRSTGRSLRSRFPRFLCKSTKEEKCIEGSQTTHTYGLVTIEPKMDGKGRSPSAFRPISSPKEPARPNTSASMFDLVPRVRDGNKDKASVVSCPDFAAASACLHKEAAKKASHRSAELVLPERHCDRSSKRAVDDQGTSAILPGAIDPALEQFLAMEKARSGNEAAGPTRGRSIEPVWRRAISSSSNGGQRQRRGSDGSPSVQMRRTDPEKQLDPNRPLEHVRKVQWQLCKSTGTYKKKIVFDHQQTE